MHQFTKANSLCVYSEIHWVLILLILMIKTLKVVTTSVQPQEGTTVYLAKSFDEHLSCPSGVWFKCTYC